MFAGSCISVICLVMTLELLRRLTKEYDRYLIRRHTGSSNIVRVNVAPNKAEDQGSSSSSIHTPHDSLVASRSAGFRPSIIEQATRALLHMLQFAVAYIVMLYVPTTKTLMSIHLC